MKPAKLYFKHRLQTLSMLLENACAPYNSESFHQLRVEIKKLVAFFKLLQFCSKKFHKRKKLKAYKIIFEQAGIVRELDIVDAIVAKHISKTALPKYSNYLNTITTNECSVFFTMLQKHPVKSVEAMHKKIKPVLSKITEKKSSHYLDKLYKRLYHMSGRKGVATASQQHDMRKLLKTIAFTKKCCDLEKNDQADKEEHILSQLLGTWHDDYVTIQYLREAMHLATIPQNEKNELHAIATMLKAENISLLKKINSHKANLHATVGQHI